MKLSIITPSFNQGSYIEECIQSVLNQKYPNFEHIIIDGGSSDNTVSILEKYKHLIWVSEPDKGQADALSKGLKIAKGEVIGWINSDDYYLEGTFNRVMEIFNQKKNDWLVSNEIMLFPNYNIESRIADINYKSLLKNPDIVKQQGAFYRKDLIIKAGGFDENMYMVMDYDLWIRLAKYSEPYKLDYFTAAYRHHENQKTSAKNILTQFKEIRQIHRREKTSRMSTIRIGLIKYRSYFKKRIKSLLVFFHLLNRKYLSESIYKD
jgi:glycosyltransferase involved in cell wall biosynthesis